MKRKKVIVTLLIFTIVAAAFAPAAFAQVKAKESGKSYLDVFTLRVLVLEDGAGEREVAEAELTRPLEIRIPQRPPLRSAFRPDY